MLDSSEAGDPPATSSVTSKMQPTGICRTFGTFLLAGSRPTGTSLRREYSLHVALTLYIAPGFVALPGVTGPERISFWGTFRLAVKPRHYLALHPLTLHHPRFRRSALLTGKGVVITMPSHPTFSHIPVG